MAEKRSFPFFPAFLIGGTVLYCAYRFNHALIPFLLSFALAYVVNPVVNNFETRGLRRDHIVLGFYSLIALCISLLANYLLPTVSGELAHLQEQAPVYFTNLQKLGADLQARVAHSLPYGRKAIESLSMKMYAPVIEQLQHVPGYLLGLFPLLSLLFLVPFITFFLLLDGASSISKGIQACPSRHVEQALHLISEIDTALGNYLRGIIIVALAIAAASFVGLSAMGVNYALAISVLSGISSFVPYLGAIIGALVGGLVAFFQFGTFAAAVKVVILFFGIRLADEALLQPIIAKHSVHLHPLIFLFSLMLGGEVFGLIGLVFAVPAACILKALLKVAWAWYSSEIQLNGPASYDSQGVPYT